MSKTSAPKSRSFRAVDGQVHQAATATIVDFPAPGGSPPKAESGNVPPKRRKNADIPSREYLLADEVDQLARAAGGTGRHGHRDATLILIAYRHALRISELVALRWDQVDLKAGTLHVHPHMLRHAAGYQLANDGHDTRAIQQYMGHQNIAHTVRYTELAPRRFSDFWKD